MPDYTEAAMKDGWIQVGTKWKNTKHPELTRYSAKQIWDEDLPANLKRPNSASEPPRPPKPPEAPHVAAVAPEPKVELPAPPPPPEPPAPPPEASEPPHVEAKKRGRPRMFKRDRDGYLVPKED